MLKERRLYLTRVDLNFVPPSIEFSDALSLKDYNNSKVADIIRELQSYSLQVHVTDPHANSDELKHEYGFELTPELSNDYAAIIVTVPHKAYLSYDDNSFTGMTQDGALIADIKGIYGGKISSRAYWSL